MYKSHLDEFLDWLRTSHPELRYLDEIRDVDDYWQKLDTSVAVEFVEHLKTLKQAVDTHNKKLSRIGIIFRALGKYLVAPSPWENKRLRRNLKEESGITERRKPFPSDKEKEMFEALFHILKYTGQRQKDAVLAVVILVQR